MLVGIGHRGFIGFLRSAIAQIPNIGHTVSLSIISIYRSGNCEGQRTCILIYDKTIDYRSTVTAIVFNIAQTTIRISREPTTSIFQQVNASVWAHFHIDEIVELNIFRKRFHFVEGTIFEKVNGHHPTAHPIVNDHFSIVISGQASSVGIHIGPIGWSSHSITATGTYLRKILDFAIMIVYVSWFGRWQFPQTRVVFGIVDRFLRVKLSFGLPRFVIVFAIGKIITNKHGPAIITRLASLVHFVIPPWTPCFQTIYPCIWSNIAPIYIASFHIHGNPVRVSVTHGINFRSGFFSAHRK